MAYRRREMWFPRSAEMWEFHDCKYGAPGQKRAPRRKATEEEIKQHNRRNREKKCRWKLRANFTPDDIFVTCTCRKDARPPDMDTMTKMVSRMLRELRKHYQAAGVELKWIRNIECGTKGAWHVHIVLNDVPDAIKAMKKAWPHGNIVIRPMRAEGDFQDLAAYLTKTPETDKSLKDARHWSSKNLLVPAPVERKYNHWKTFAEAEPRMIPKGWYVDKSSVYEGITKMGYRFRRFQLFPLDDKQRERHPGKMIRAGNVPDIEAEESG